MSRAHGCAGATMYRMYGYMEVIGRVESGTETESNAGAVAEDVRSEKAPR